MIQINLNVYSIKNFILAAYIFRKIKKEAYYCGAEIKETSGGKSLLIATLEKVLNINEVLRLINIYAYCNLPKLN